MNKTDRLFAIVLELQGRSVVRAQDLAQLFETSIRTIYRDIQALSEAGVPIFGSPGQGYSLLEGYFLPPVSFTVEEAAALIIGADFVEQRFDEAYGRHARFARGKIEALLPPGKREETKRVRESIRIIHPEDRKSLDLERSHIELIRGALSSGRKMRFDYAGRPDGERSNPERTTRTAAPYGLVLLNGRWILVAHCELRGAIRNFRVSRIRHLQLTNEPYDMPADFRLEEYAPEDDRHIRVKLLFDAALAGRVEQQPNFYTESSDLTAEGYEVDYRVRRPEELLSWILGWGSRVIVLEPESLKERVRQEIEEMGKRY
ncbi:transcriptional regulator [Saccharibacillus sp. O16]|nr:transcriptional regulator [Saccharibacillus sp. O16]